MKKKIGNTSQFSGFLTYGSFTYEFRDEKMRSVYMNLSRRVAEYLQMAGKSDRATLIDAKIV